MHGAPEGSLGLVNASGWMTSINVVKVLDHVIKFTGCSTGNPIILTMDSHESHIALDSAVTAKENGIHIVNLLLGTVKTYFKSAANSRMMEHPGKMLTIYELAKLMGSAWLKAATPVNINILSGFRQYIRHLIAMYSAVSSSCLPSLVTARPLLAEVLVLDSSAACPVVADSDPFLPGLSY